jgi:hypothetical protein
MAKRKSTSTADKTLLPGYYRDKDGQLRIEQPPQQPPQPQNYRLDMGSTLKPQNSGGFIGQTIEVKRSTRKPSSLDEMGREQPGQGKEHTLFGIPGAYVVSKRDRIFNTESGWSDL